MSKMKNHLLNHGKVYSYSYTSYCGIYISRQSDNMIQYITDDEDITDCIRCYKIFTEPIAYFIIPYDDKGYPCNIFYYKEYDKYDKRINYKANKSYVVAIKKLSHIINDYIYYYNLTLNYEKKSYLLNLVLNYYKDNKNVLPYRKDILERVSEAIILV